MALRAVVDTSHHQFVLAPLDVFAVVGIEPSRQLVALTDSADASVVGLGVRDGKVEVSVTSDPAEGWGLVEDEAEVTVVGETGQVLDGLSTALTLVIDRSATGIAQVLKLAATSSPPAASTPGASPPKTLS